jgi:hypothetical protein
VMFHVEVFWVVTPCSVVAGYRRFRSRCFLHLSSLPVVPASFSCHCATFVTYLNVCHWMIRCSV